MDRVPLSMSHPRALNIGSGAADQLPGAVRLDRARAARPHVVADLDEGLPFRAAVFDTVAAYDVVEHAANLVALVREVHRVLRQGGTFLVTTPHFSSANAFTDPTHRRAFGLRSFDYFLAGHPLGASAHVEFRKRRASVFFKGRVVGRLAGLLARRFPDWWEHRLAWMLPAWFLYFELEAVK